MEPVTTYKSESGEVKVIAEMNNFHLVNALIKGVIRDAVKEVSTNNSGTVLLSHENKALKDEALKRMDNRPQANA